VLLTADILKTNNIARLKNKILVIIKKIKLKSNSILLYYVPIKTVVIINQFI
jgi:hypothetical protein